MQKLWLRIFKKSWSTFLPWNSKILSRLRFRKHNGGLFTVSIPYCSPSHIPTKRSDSDPVFEDNELERRLDMNACINRQSKESDYRWLYLASDIITAISMPVRIMFYKLNYKSRVTDNLDRLITQYLSAEESFAYLFWYFSWFCKYLFSHFP